jgi:hypothetical protein
MRCSVRCMCLRVHACARVCMCTCMCFACACMHPCVGVCVCAFYVYVYVHGICARTRACTRMCVCMRVCMYVCMYVCMCICYKQMRMRVHVVSTAHSTGWWASSCAWESSCPYACSNTDKYTCWCTYLYICNIIIYTYLYSGSASVQACREENQSSCRPWDEPAWHVTKKKMKFGAHGCVCKKQNLCFDWFIYR